MRGKLSVRSAIIVYMYMYRNVTSDICRKCKRAKFTTVQLQLNGAFDLQSSCTCTETSRQTFVENANVLNWQHWSEANEHVVFCNVRVGCCVMLILKWRNRKLLGSVCKGKMKLAELVKRWTFYAVFLTCWQKIWKSFIICKKVNFFQSSNA